MSYSILTVDDSPLMRTVVARTLRLAEVPVSELHEASNGREALALLHEKWIDLVLTDLNMPEMSGVELVARMAEDGLLATVPVVVLSSLGEESTLAGLTALGVRGYLRKPFTPESLMKIIRETLEGNHAS
jgi:two-component system chemotaxis response regulator CheY